MNKETHANLWQKIDKIAEMYKQCGSLKTKKNRSSPFYLVARVIISRSASLARCTRALLSRHAGMEIHASEARLRSAHVMRHANLGDDDAEEVEDEVDREGEVVACISVCEQEEKAKDNLSAPPQHMKKGVKNTR